MAFRRTTSKTTVSGSTCSTPTSCLASSSGFTILPRVRGQAWDWRSVSGSFIGTAGGSGPSHRPITAQPSASPYQRASRMPSSSTQILIVEDNPDDLELTLDALAEHHVANRIQVARDGVEAL